MQYAVAKLENPRAEKLLLQRPRSGVHRAVKVESRIFKWRHHSKRLPRPTLPLRRPDFKGNWMDNSGKARAEEACIAVVGEKSRDGKIGV